MLATVDELIAVIARATAAGESLPPALRVVFAGTRFFGRLRLPNTGVFGAACAEGSEALDPEQGGRLTLKNDPTGGALARRLRWPAKIDGFNPKSAAGGAGGAGGGGGGGGKGGLCGADGSEDRGWPARPSPEKPLMSGGAKP